MRESATVSAYTPTNPTCQHEWFKPLILQRAIGTDYFEDEIRSPSGANYKGNFRLTNSTFHRQPDSAILAALKWGSAGPTRVGMVELSY